jgi:Tfp pilus assembly protein PilZ
MASNSWKEANINLSKGDTFLPTNKNYRWTNQWYLIRRYSEEDYFISGRTVYWTVAFGGSDRDAAVAYAERLGLTEENGMVIEAGALTATLMLLNR